jgi:hypothetical protein
MISKRQPELVNGFLDRRRKEGASLGYRSPKPYPCSRTAFFIEKPWRQKVEPAVPGGL